VKDPFPVPLALPVIVIHSAALVAVHEHPAGPATVTRAESPNEATTSCPALRISPAASATAVGSITA